MAGIVDIVNQLGTLAQAQSGDQNKGEEKKSRSKHVNSISRAA